MTTTEPIPSPATNDAWAAQLEQLRARYQHVREPILAALQILMANPAVGVDGAKAEAAAHGVRITAASISGARRLLSRMDDKPAAAAAPATNGTTAPQRPARRARVAEVGLDAEALIRGVVAKIQGQGAAEAERMRDGIRRAIAILQGLVG